jgi:hypothetical protein
MHPHMPTLKVTTRDRHVYAMQGATFQQELLHSLAGQKKSSGGRFGLTFRTTCYNLMEIMFEENCVRLQENFVPEGMFASLKAELEPFLKPDTTKMYGELFLNGGRLSAEFMDRVLWENEEKAQGFKYRYGGQDHYGNLMTPSLQALADIISRDIGHEHAVDWCHVTYYPDNLSKLGYHADDEPQIKLGSRIYCITLMERPQDTRTLLIKYKPTKPDKSPSKSKPIKIPAKRSRKSKMF